MDGADEVFKMEMIGEPDWMACSMWSRGPSFSPLVQAGKHSFQRYNSTVIPKIVHYEARPIAHLDIILIFP